MKSLSFLSQEHCDQGPHIKLAIYTFMSFALAAAGYSIPTFGRYEVASKTAIGGVWLLVAMRGTVVCGWPALVLWLPIYWAFSYPAMATFAVVLCLSGGCEGW